MKIENIEQLSLKLECPHLNETHVIVTDEDLISRLVNGEYTNGRLLGFRTDIASKFYDEDICKKAIIETIKYNESDIRRWLDFRTEKRLYISKTFLHPVGYGFAKWTNFRKNKYEMYACNVILSLGYNGSDFNIVTAYPDTNHSVFTKIINDRKLYRMKKKRK